jgi:DNA-binding NarL/FixJ family response regulator
VGRILGVNTPPDRTEETTMHPTISYYLTQASTADLRRQAQQATLAQAARPARPRQHGYAAPLLSALGRLARRRSSHRIAPQVPTSGSDVATSMLTPRELDVLRLVAQGLSNSGIARQLVLSEHTVHRHLANIFRKLDLSSRAAAAAWGVRTGLV